jgi:hypothetical protein
MEAGMAAREVLPTAAALGPDFIFVSLIPLFALHTQAGMGWL